MTNSMVFENALFAFFLEIVEEIDGAFMSLWLEKKNKNGKSLTATKLSCSTNAAMCH